MALAAAIIAVIVIVVLVVIIVKVAIICCVYREAKKDPELRIQMPSTVTFGTPTFPSVNQESNSSAPHEKRFTFEQVVRMTDNFKSQIGRGGFGSVYSGRMTDGKAVAVKRLSSESNQGRVQFQNEVDILLRVHHRNLVSLIGYCEDFKERILIYEFIQEGALADHLHGSENRASKPPLNWETRIRIAVDAANGLKYLHTDCDPRIIHRDVKAGNILLDEKLSAKVADFGLSKSFPQPSQTHVTTAVMGTIGYLDPEYANGLGRLTDKSDVYSFGIVLLELLSGCKCILGTPSGFENISVWARPYILGGKLNEIVDKSLGDNYDVKAFNAVAVVALSCVKDKGFARPSMSKVLEELELIAKTHLKPRPMVGTNNFDLESQLESSNSIPQLESKSSIPSDSLSTMPLIWDHHGQHHE